MTIDEQTAARPATGVRDEGEGEGEADDGTHEAAAGGSAGAQPAPSVRSAEPLLASAPYRDVVSGPADGPSRKPAHPVLGPSLAAYGAALWSFVVAGTFTTTWSLRAPLPESVAWVAVVLATSLAWGRSMRASLRTAPPKRRLLVVTRTLLTLALGLGLVLVTLLIATIVGNLTDRRVADFWVALLVCALGVAATALGPRLTSRTHEQPTHSARVRRVMAWGVAGLLSLVAFIDLAADG